jgi:cytochrome c biogenesis protein CcdA
MAAAGIAFAAGVFLSYLLIGYGFLSAFRLGGRLEALRLALRILVSALAAAFCALTVRDIVVLRGGGPAGAVLALPESVRLRINAAIRSGVGQKVFLPGVFVTGIVVSILELACTGQVYFPAISYMVQTEASVAGLRSLLLYNLAFITPLLAVLVLALAGVGQASVRSYFVRHVVPAKVAQALVFAGLAVLAWIA